ncbi:MAG: TlpA family protein disulfide reductase [Planctomycetes bacterium]|nr:TlpA family protein disulfide reductase [Planctomycetota bacterium]
MKKYLYRNHRTPNPLPSVLLAGLLVGIVLSWILVRGQASDARPALTETPTYRSPIMMTSTLPSIRIVEITPQMESPPIAIIGKPAPDFSLKNMEGKMINLSAFHGKVVLINLWASWCPPCRYEMPGIQAAYEKYKDEGLVVLGIDFTVQDNLQGVKEFIQELKLTFPILLDETGDISAGLYGMRGLPTSFFIDSEGILKRIQVGAMLPEKLDEYLAEILPK